MVVDEVFIAEALREQGEAFPYKRAFLGDPAVLFDNLCSDTSLYFFEQGAHPSWTYPGCFPGHTWYVRVARGNYDKCDALADYFTEEPRVRSRVRGKYTAFETWEHYRRNDFDVLVSAAKAGVEANPQGVEKILRGNCASALKTFVLREAIYQLCYECTQFKPSLARAVLEFCSGHLGAARDLSVLDPCMGWGDRLLAALSLNVRTYVGVDPNPEVHVWDERALASLRAPGGTRVRNFCMPFEAASFSESFDVVFTSPPFFNYETYWCGSSIAERHQCAQRYERCGDWLRGWLVPFACKCLSLLKRGGLFVLHLSDTSAGSYCRELVSELESRGFPLRGTLAFQREKGRVFPLWVWSSE